MPHWGGAWGAPYGDYADMLLVFAAEDLGDGLGFRLTLRAAPDYGGLRWDIVVGGAVRANVVVSEEADTVITVPYGFDFARTLPESVAVSAVCVGDWVEASGDSAGYQTEFTAITGARCVILRWDARPETTLAYGDDGHFSGVTLNGVGRGAGRIVDRQNEFDLAWEYSGGSMTVAVQSGGIDLASGARASAGTIVLDEQNESGISGTIYWDGETVLPVGMVVRVRWPKSHKVYFYPTGESPASQTPRMTIADNGSIAQAVTVTDLAAGIYDYFVRAVSDTGLDGANLTVQGTVTVPGPPQPPTELSCTRPVVDPQFVEWVDSVTPGASYRIYTGDVGEPIDFSTVAASVPAGVEEWELPVPGGDGITRVCVESVLAGVESGYRRMINVEWLAGVRVLDAPNAPAFELDAKTGLLVKCNWYYSANEQLVAPSHMRLLLRSEAGAVISQDAAIGEATSGSVLLAASAGGWWNYAVAAVSAEGAVSAFNYRGPLWLSEANPAAPAAVLAEVV